LILLETPFVFLIVKIVFFGQQEHKKANWQNNENNKKHKDGEMSTAEAV
jgi:hypothetical protein